MFFQLIEYECRPSKQVPVLLRLGEDQTALRKALLSGDADLIYTVLFHLRDKMPHADFLVIFFLLIFSKLVKKKLTRMEVHFINVN